ncbi:hypothetical protein BST81_14675 [Leptolyngbya sp. 'hensonii']|nr:hypothetical protein BST81_14675 [Leptolyngbya sp. 'hensonii']
MLDSSPSTEDPNQSPLILDQSAVKRCHIRLLDVPRPMGAIYYRKQFYSFVKIFPAMDAAMRGAQRLISRGNSVILTTTPKGIALWVLEPEAQLVSNR